MRVASIVVASSNPEKAAALERVAALAGAADVRRLGVTVDERGTTFADNAREKARAASLAAPSALALASDGGLKIPALGARWDPLRTARSSPREESRAKAASLLRLMRDLHGDRRAAQWVEALAVAYDGSILATWTERGRRSFVRETPPSAVGPLWVDALLVPAETGPDHWELLARRFEEFLQQ